MKISEKILKSASIGYLYGNGKLVIIHRQPHKQAGEVLCGYQLSTAIATVREAS